MDHGEDLDLQDAGEELVAGENGLGDEDGEDDKALMDYDCS